MTAPLSRNGLTLIRCRDLGRGDSSAATPGVLRAIARTLRLAADKDHRVTISDKMARFLADLCERSQVPSTPLDGAS